MADDRDYEAELDALIAQLDALPPEVLKQLIIERGGVEASLSSLARLANSDDPEVRQQARQIIEERELGFILLPTTDDPPA